MYRFIASSSNPWVLAELQQALLQHPAAERERLSEERSGERSGESSDEVVVVRVALPSAAERKHVREPTPTARPLIARAIHLPVEANLPCSYLFLVLVVERVQIIYIYLRSHPYLTISGDENDIPFCVLRVVLLAAVSVISVPIGVACATSPFWPLREMWESKTACQRRTCPCSKT